MSDKFDYEAFRDRLASVITKLTEAIEEGKVLQVKIEKLIKRLEKEKEKEGR